MKRNQSKRKEKTKAPRKTRSSAKSDRQQSSENPVPSTSQAPDLPVAHNPLDPKKEVPSLPYGLMTCVFSWCSATMTFREARDHIRTVHRNAMLLCFYCKNHIFGRIFMDHMDQCKLKEENGPRMRRKRTKRGKCSRTAPSETTATHDLLTTSEDSPEHLLAAAGASSDPNAAGPSGYSGDDIKIVDERVVHPLPVATDLPRDSPCFGNYHEAIVCPIEGCHILMRKNFIDTHIIQTHLNLTCIIKCKYCHDQLPSEHYISTHPRYHLKECLMYERHSKYTLHLIRGNNPQLD